MEAAQDETRRRRPHLDADLVELLGRIVLLEHEEPVEHAAELAARFQQTSGPVAAKGVEDTAMYRYHRLVALNEVGGDPCRFGTSPKAFHVACARSAERWPAGMLATSTHDTKRSEDVRARLAILSEIPDAWAAAVERWSAMNVPYRDRGQPDRGAEYLLYQTLVGAWPIGQDRLLPYLEKAVREAKLQTSWLAPSASYERSLRDFAAGILDSRAFVADLEAFLAGIVDAGRVNSLAMKLLCLTAPGVPDVYQGSELWDLSLVDPDNRRPVDFPVRSRLLAELDALGDRAAAVAWERRAEGLPKLLVVSRALRLRGAWPEAFAGGAYRELPVAGPCAAHAVAFCRGEAVCAVVPRLSVRLQRSGGWTGTAVELPPGDWVDRLTGRASSGGEVPVAKLLAGFPVALLERA
jgi:(1->4)-alpha-D-glucan 1-alpha-D-glucosylmutase